MLKNDGSFGAKMERAKEPENTEKMRPGLKGSSKCEYTLYQLQYGNWKLSTLGKCWNLSKDELNNNNV